MLVEIQALVSSSKYGTGRRMTQGVDQNRVALMIAMLEKRAGLQLLGDDVFVNIAGGMEVDEPAVDLGLVTAIASSFRNQPIDAHTAVFGEVGLTGEVRGATRRRCGPAKHRRWVSNGLSCQRRIPRAWKSCWACELSACDQLMKLCRNCSSSRQWPGSLEPSPAFQPASSLCGACWCLNSNDSSVAQAFTPGNERGLVSKPH